MLLEQTTAVKDAAEGVAAQGCGTRHQAPGTRHQAPGTDARGSASGGALRSRSEANRRNIASEGWALDHFGELPDSLGGDVDGPHAGGDALAASIRTMCNKCLQVLSVSLIDQLAASAAARLAVLSGQHDCT